MGIPNLLHGETMSMIQMELNLDNKSEQELQFEEIRKELADTKESLRKIQKKLFGEMAILKKVCLTLQKEIQDLKETQVTKKETNVWLYGKGDCLFIEEKQEAVC